ncbi:MAG: hypothetical protein V7664_13100 [Qipengyuania sp.]|uniref:hypothetical protein n=1 Tax=Qipengyuania sp. TaxID=2004515 RepID=UPI0030029755
MTETTYSADGGNEPMRELIANYGHLSADADGVSGDLNSISVLNALNAAVPGHRGEA